MQQGYFQDTASVGSFATAIKSAAWFGVELTDLEGYQVELRPGGGGEDWALVLRPGPGSLAPKITFIGDARGVRAIHQDFADRSWLVKYADGTSCGRQVSERRGATTPPPVLQLVAQALAQAPELSQDYEVTWRCTARNEFWAIISAVDGCFCGVGVKMDAMGRITIANW